MRRSDPPAAARTILLVGSMLCAAMSMPASARVPGAVVKRMPEVEKPGASQTLSPSHPPPLQGPYPTTSRGTGPFSPSDPVASPLMRVPNTQVPVPGSAALNPPGAGFRSHAPAAGYLGPSGPVGSSSISWSGTGETPDDLTCDSCPADDCWTFQILPDGLMYRSYLAGTKESRFASVWNYEQDLGWLWDITLGGRVGVLRYGTASPFHPEGWQLDVEGFGQPRLDLEIDSELISSDFRFGIPLTYRRGIWETKLAYYHLSSHLGDEFMIRNPTVTRINYSRDALVLAAAVRPLPVLRLYAEGGWAFASDVSEPWEFQFGGELSMREPTGLRGAPFLAVNGHIREEVGFGGNLVAQIGWQWRGYGSGHLMRLGAEYYTGKSRQFEFFDESEQQLGMGLWYDY